MGMSKERIIFVINRYDKRIAIHAERVSENLKHEVSATIPLDEKVVITAVDEKI